VAGMRNLTTQTSFYHCCRCCVPQAVPPALAKTRGGSMVGGGAAASSGPGRLELPILCGTERACQAEAESQLACQPASAQAWPSPIEVISDFLTEMTGLGFAPVQQGAACGCSVATGSFVFLSIFGSCAGGSMRLFDIGTPVTNVLYALSSFPG
jgi:hypothetical protein